MDNGSNLAKDHKFPIDPGSRSPGRVFSIGLAVGIIILILGSFGAAFLGGRGSAWGPALQWAIPLLGSAAAAGTVASMKGGSRGRVISVAVLALCGVFSLSGLLDFVLIFAKASSLINVNSATGFPRQLWSRHLIVSLVSIIGGALLGLMFGKRAVPHDEISSDV